MERLLLILGAGFTLILLVYVTVMQMDNNPQQYPLLGQSSSVPDDAWFEEEVTRSELPVLVDFTTTWCGYCKQLAPVLDDLEKAYGGRLKLVKVDGDEHATVVRAFQIQGYPTLMLVKDGKVVDYLPGMARYETIEKMILPHVAQKRVEYPDHKAPDGPSGEVLQAALLR